VEDAAAEGAVRKLLQTAEAALDRVVFHRWPTNRVWTRDYGPIFVVRDAEQETTDNREVALVNFGFNAWAKYPDWKLDNQIPSRVARELRCREFEAQAELAGKRKSFVLEGGSIDVNGRGTLLTTDECLLSEVQQRNPGLARGDIERALHDYLGITNVLWLGNGIVGDDTHGHVDDIARFIAPDTIAAAVEPNRSDPNHTPLAENLKRLRAMRDQDGRQFTIVELPMPRAIVFRKYRVPASYANFYIANGVALVPVFNDPNDRIALNSLASAFSAREIVPIYCGDLIWGFGAIHCMTQQQPASGG
jgi:agmatine deiminase